MDDPNVDLILGIGAAGLIYMAICFILAAFIAYRKKRSQFGVVLLGIATLPLFHVLAPLFSVAVALLMTPDYFKIAEAKGMFEPPAKSGWDWDKLNKGR